MPNRTRLLLAVAVVSLAFTLGPSIAEEPKSATPPKLNKADIEGMLKSLSNWGRWGADDQLGAINLITPEKRKAAAGLVTEGVSVSLAHNLGKSATGDSSGFTYKMLALPKDTEFSFTGDEYTFAYHGFTVTHMDSLCHMFYKGQMYNGFSRKEINERGADKLSVLNFKQGIVTRGILMDMPRLFGVRFLEGGQPILPAHLEAWEKAAGVKVGSGDAVLINTGRWSRAKLAGDWEIMKSSAGLHASCLPWLKERDVAVVGSDLALDVLPSQVEGVEFPVHCVVLVAMGMPILDNLDLDAISEAAAARKRWSFMLTVAPLAVPTGTGSPVNPLGTF
jgi:kynurenine formamidase